MKTIKTNFLNKTGIYIGIIALCVSSCELDEDLPGVNETVLELEGTWLVIENGQKKSTKSALDAYEVTISPDPDNTDGVIIDNFFDVGISVKANISDLSFIIPNQNAEDDYKVFGSGTISSNLEEIDMDYEVDDGSGVFLSYTAVYTKK